MPTLTPRHPHHRRRVRLAAALIAPGMAIMATACTGAPPPEHLRPSSSAVPTLTADAAGRLTVRVAAARDRTFTAVYSYTPTALPPRMITVMVAPDGTWRVDVPGGALGGTANITLAQVATGLFQCQANPAPACVRVGPAGAAVPAAIDPRVEHLFVDWLIVLTDPQQALSVAAARTLPGVAGDCFSVEPSAASLAAPIDSSILCYDTAGTLTAAATAWGRLTLAAAPTPPPATVSLPGPIVVAAPLPTASPSPPPAPSASASAVPHQ